MPASLESTARAQFGPLFLLVFGILSPSDVILAVLGELHAGDKGWWPVALGLRLSVSFIYSLLFCAVTRRSHLAKPGYAAVYTLTLTFSLFVHVWLLQTMAIDWLAANTHTTQLTLAQQILRSHFLPWAIYGMFLIGAILVGSRRT